MLIAFGFLAAVITAASDAPPLNPPAPSALEIQEPPQTKSDNQKGESNRSEQNTQRDSFIIKVVPSPKSDAEATQNTNGGQDKSSSDWWLVVLTGGLVFTGLLQTGVFWIQARRLKQTIVKMDDVARDASRIGQAQVRAYVNITEVTVKIKDKLLAGEYYFDEPIFHITVINTGNSPALEFQLREEATYVYIDPSNRIRGESKFFRQKGIGRNLPSGKTIIEHNSLDLRLNAEDETKLQSGDLAIVATFHYTFEDVFGNVVTDQNTFQVKFPLDALRAEHPMKTHSISAATTGSILKVPPLTTPQKDAAHSPKKDGG